MKRIRHGAVLSLEEVDTKEVGKEAGDPFDTRKMTRFYYMFEDLQKDAEALLPEGPSTVAFLARLGESMFDPAGSALDSRVPAAYTYFGQFVSHEIALELQSARIADLTSPALAPLSLAVVSSMIKNGRSAGLDLDSIYGKPAPRDGDHMILGTVSISSSPFRRPAFKDNFNDLPRLPLNLKDPLKDRQAKIGDPRNDENLIIAQLHVAFLRAHNALVDQGRTFDEASTLLRQHFQWIVLRDYLKWIADPAIVESTLARNKFFDALAEQFFLPLEFSVGAFRFGHSMVRGAYDFNINFRNENAASLGQLFTFTALGGNLGPDAGGEFLTLPEHWIIEWEGFLEAGNNKARRFDTLLVEPLFALRNEVGGPLTGDPRLAIRNLLRGYLLRLPTGQAIAKRLGVEVLAGEDLLDGTPSKQHLLLRNSGFWQRTPLWFYILAEANRLGNGNRLGPVGSTLVAEVLIGLARRSKDSILSNPGWVPTLGNGDGSFTLADLLRLGGVLAPETP